MQAYQERVITEKKELDEKLEKLYHFAITNNPNPMFLKLDLIDRDLLSEQYNAMLIYSKILDERIKRFK